MTRTAEQIFHEARGMSPAERAGYLKGACGADSVMRARVEALLKADAQDGAFVGASIDSAPTTDPSSETISLAAPVRESPGSRIGPYKILQLIGEGGFGSVFLAEQERPVTRKVALKVIKLGMDTRQVVARFEQERQALAMMDHPNIAKVLDAGATETGRPFFVMELVKGDPIVEYCDKNNLSIEDRLVLFTQVCTAVQHAHTKGIIHRDIKPSNILVSTQDGRPHTKVIDFGIAKATASKLTEKTLFTEHRQLIGTPEYMSPEQAEGSLDIDTRTDVYSLGVLLYELLTGTTPFSSNELRSAAFAEIQRIIREVEPPRPSTRISHNSNTIASIAARRHTEPRRLGSLIRGELDWIVMKALEKDRARRYETANGLAMDIRRFLTGEAVLAAPPSTAYRLKKFLRRHRGMVMAGGAVAVALLAGVVAFAWQASVARDQRDLAVQARQAEAEQRKQAEAAQAEALKQKNKAEAQEQEARKQEAQATRLAAIAQAVAKFQTDMLAAVDPNQLPRDPVTKEPLKDAVTVVQAMEAAVKALDEGSLADQPVVEAHVRRTIGSTMKSLGRYAAAEVNQRKSLTLLRETVPAGHPMIADALCSLGSTLIDQRKSSEAVPFVREALEIYRAAYPAGHPSIAQALVLLGAYFIDQGKPTEAEPFVREALEIRRATLPVGHPTIASSLNILAGLLSDQAKYAEAESLYREVIKIYRAAYPAGHPSIADSLDNLGKVMIVMHKEEEAESLLREALAIRRAALPARHPGLALGLNNLASVLLSEDDLAEAESLMREALEISREIYPPGHLELAASLDNLSKVLGDQGKFDEAEQLMRESLDIRRAQLREGHPEIETGLNNLGWIYWKNGKFDQSIPLFEEVLRMRRNDRSDLNLLPTVANLGVNYLAAGRIEEALPLLEEAYANLDRHPRLDGIEGPLLDAYTQLVDPARPETLARVVKLIHELLARTRSRHPAEPTELGNQLATYVLTLLRLKAWDEAEPLVREALTIRQETAPDDWRTFNTQSMLGGVLLGQKKLAEAEPLLLDGLKGLEERAASIPPPGRPRIPDALDRLVKLYEAKGDEAAAETWRARLEAARAELARSGAPDGTK